MQKHGAPSLPILRNLTLASPELNRFEKRAKDAADWLPPQHRCWFAGQVIAVRRAYALTIDRREADALERVLANCDVAADLMTTPAPVIDGDAGCQVIGTMPWWTDFG